MAVYEYPISGVIRINAETISDANDIIARGLKNAALYHRASLQTTYGDPITVEDFNIDRFIVPVTWDELDSQVGFSSTH